MTYKPGCWICPHRLARIAGLVPVVAVTQAEADLFDGVGALQLRSLNGIKERSIQAGIDYANANGIAEGGTRADAVRHAYWNALMVREVGRDKARDLATAHEQVIGNFQADEAMDLWNNLQGREIASSNPAASDAELLQLAVSAVEAGQMVVVRDVGSLAWSSSSVGTPLFRPDTPPGAVHDEYGTPYGPVLG